MVWGNHPTIPPSHPVSMDLPPFGGSLIVSFTRRNSPGSRGFVSVETEALFGTAV
jgi:hypothetical protein